MRPRLPSRLSWKLLLAILPPVVLAVAAVVWWQYAAARRQMLASIHTEMDEIARRTADGVDEQIGERYRDLFTLSETPLIADYYRNVDYGLHDEADSYRLELGGYLRRFSRRSGAYALILYLDARGREVCRVAAPGVPPSARGPTAEDFARVRALPGSGWRVSGVEELPGAGPVVYFAKPVRGDLGEFKGELVLGYDLSALRRMLSTVAVGRRGRAYLSARGGELIVGATDIPREAGPLLTARRALRRQPRTLVVAAPLEDFLAPLKSVRDAAIAAALAAAGLLIPLLLLLVRTITRPLAALAAAARRIGAGDFSTRVEAGEGELGELAAAFNEMTARLEENRRVNARLQSQLVQAEKLSAVGQLISAVAHELNNPLGAISGWVQIALLEDCPPRMREDLTHVFANVKRCAKVVENLLFFARKSRHERRPVDLNAAAAAALDLLEYRLVKTEDVRVVRELASDSPTAVGDFQQIVQVLVNLITNACDAMQGVARWPDGKRLVLRTAARDGRVLFELEDNGAGIPPERRARIFEAFYTTKEHGRGTGLGLTVCRQILREHGGDLSFESRPGAGTVFRADLPAADAAALDEFEVLPEAYDPPPVPGRRVLVVDDEKDIADLIARLLREDGDEVRVAYGGHEGLKLLQEGRYDLVISDVEMEGVKGPDLYAALAALDAPTRMLFVTGDILNPKVLDFLSKTGSEPVLKPFDLEEMRRTVRRLLAEPRRADVR
ncbi:MAG: response regulator [Elusimicrobia bacterium]|nr:response regulator [Elusimicrobiota bacterium]